MLASDFYQQCLTDFFFRGTNQIKSSKSGTTAPVSRAVCQSRSDFSGTRMPIMALPAGNNLALEFARHSSVPVKMFCNDGAGTWCTPRPGAQACGRGSAAGGPRRRRPGGQCGSGPPRQVIGVLVEGPQAEPESDCPSGHRAGCPSRAGIG